MSTSTRFSKRRTFQLTYININVHNIKDDKHIVFRDVNVIKVSHTEGTHNHSENDTKMYINNLRWRKNKIDTNKYTIETNTDKGKEQVIFNYYKDGEQSQEINKLIMDVDIYIEDKKFKNFRAEFSLEVINTSKFLQMKQKIGKKFDVLASGANKKVRGIRRGIANWFNPGATPGN